MNDLVLLGNKNVYTTSLIVADYFGKRHDNVVRDIENLDCSKDFFLLNFEEIKYLDEKGRTQKSYKIKKDGLVFLIMGYRGQKASELKEEYIQQFNKMKKKLDEMNTPEWEQLRLTSKSSTKILHETIDKVFRPYAISKGSKNYRDKKTIAYTHFEEPINKALGISKNEREYLDKKGQTLLDLMNNAVICLIEDGTQKCIDYHEIVSIAKNKINQITDIFNFGLTT